MDIDVNDVLAAHVTIENWLIKEEGELQYLHMSISSRYPKITLPGAVLDRKD